MTLITIIWNINNMDTLVDKFGNLNIIAIYTSWEGPSRMGLVRILELGNFMFIMLHLVMVVTHFEHFIKSNYFCSPSTIG